MFHWICPECGQEIAPTARECPVCDPSAATAEPALVGVVEAPTARAFSKEAPTISDDAPIARSLRIETPKARTAPAPEPVEPLLPQLGGWQNPDPLGVLSATLEPAAVVPEPPRAQRSLPMAVRAVPHALRTLIAELGPAADQPRSPVNQPLPAKPSPEPPLIVGKSAMTRPGLAVGGSLKPFGAKLLPFSAAAVRPLTARTPNLDLAPALAPLANYNPLAGRPLRPAPPTPNVRKHECGPRLTLAGPALAASLVRFQDQALNPIPAAGWRFKKRLIPGWLAGALISGTVLAAGLNSVFFLSRPAVDAKTVAETAKPPAPLAVAPASATASPLSKTIEVTGFRIQMDPAKKSEIQYLVVNHSVNSIAGVTVYVTLYAANAPVGQAPLARFQFAAPKLGAFESKEMSSAIERVTRPIAPPGWQDLRADIEIGQ